MRFIPWRLALFALAWAVCVAATAAEAALQTKTCGAAFRDGVVIALTNRLTGESFVHAASNPAPLAALHCANEPLLTVRGVEEVISAKSLQQSAAWPTNDARWQFRCETDAASGDLLITQFGECGGKKLSGISWGIADIPDSFDVLVPGCSGQRFSAASPAGRREFDYPMMWEAPFVLIQGLKGGFIIRAEDAGYRFKNLLVEHTRHAFRLRFESRAFAPFEDKDRIESSRWRISAYRGPWQIGATIYRRWAQKHYGLTPLERQQPAWARDIQFVVTMSLDQSLLAELARQCNPPQTLLYLPNWRRDGYDRNYPDYTAVTNFGAFVTEAHRLGFRVMPHVNYFGCDPKNPVFERFKAYQARDPLSKELLWWEWPAEPPIKFAYINPASRAWRELYVARLKEVVTRCHVDAFHLDQTLCIYNDANGLVDGLNFFEGNVALHRELRAALPDVALSGEGLNEVTCRYEAFAQRHVWGMDHAHGTWDHRLIAMAHPVSSAVLTPFTQLYGYLGLVNPASTDAFVAWQRAYENFGVLPTYTWPTKAQLDQPPQAVAEVLARARFFQQHRPRPDFEVPWQPNDVFVYRLADGGRAFFRRENGVLFGSTFAKKSKIEVLSRRIEGVNEARVNGSIPGWAAYDSGRAFGLDPRQAYAWASTPGDPSALHLAGLPAGTVVEQCGRHAEFARFRLGQSGIGSGDFRLWDFAGEVSAGVQFADGTTRRDGALDFDDDSGGVTHPDGEGLFLHPPYKDLPAGSGRPVTFLEFKLRLPPARRAVFESGVHLREGAVGRSDGVDFRVSARAGERTLAAEAFKDQATPKDLVLDLTPFAGNNVMLRLEVDTGPKGNPNCDWARFDHPRVSIESETHPIRSEISLVGIPVSLPAGATLLTSDGSASLVAGKRNVSKASVPIPGTIILPLSQPEAVTLPFDLLGAKFSSHVVFSDGIEQAAFGHCVASVTTSASGGESRRVLFLHPSQQGRSLADWLLKLPDGPVQLDTAIGIRDGAKSNGVAFEVQVNGATVFRKSVLPGAGWLPVRVDLGRWRGQTALLTLVSDAEGSSDCDWATWAEPKLQNP